MSIRKLIEPRFEETMDGYIITGLGEGLILVRHEHLTMLLEMSLDGSLYPFFIARAQLNPFDLNEWICALVRGQDEGIFPRISK